MQGDLFREHLHLDDRFGRIAAELAEARNASPVDQEDRTPATAATGRSRLGPQLLDQVSQRIRTVGCNVRFIEFDHRRDIGLHLPAHTFARYDDGIFGKRFVLRSVLACRRCGIGILGKGRRGERNGQRKCGNTGEIVHGKRCDPVSILFRPRQHGWTRRSRQARNVG